MRALYTGDVWPDSGEYEPVYCGVDCREGVHSWKAETVPIHQSSWQGKFNLCFYFFSDLILNICILIIYLISQGLRGEFVVIVFLGGKCKHHVCTVYNVALFCNFLK